LHVVMIAASSDFEDFNMWHRPPVAVVADRRIEVILKVHVSMVQYSLHFFQTTCPVEQFFQLKSCSKLYIAARPHSKNPVSFETRVFAVRRKPGECVHLLTFCEIPIVG
jgi:hypothetical protein